LLAEASASVMRAEDLQQRPHRGHRDRPGSDEPDLVDEHAVDDVGQGFAGPEPADGADRQQHPE
jgi:hypothetical protein